MVQPKGKYSPSSKPDSVSRLATEGMQSYVSSSPSRFQALVGEDVEGELNETAEDVANDQKDVMGLESTIVKITGVGTSPTTRQNGKKETECEQ